MTALGQECGGKDDFELADALSGLSGTEIPRAVEEIRTAPVLHDTVVEGTGDESCRKEVFEYIRSGLRDG